MTYKYKSAWDDTKYSLWNSVLSSHVFWSRAFHLIYSKSSVAGKQCYDCMRSSDGEDECGNFDSSTPKCNMVTETVSCVTTVATVQGTYITSLSRIFKTISSNGYTASDHGCDGKVFLCEGLNNECVDRIFQGVTYRTCCCDGNL